MPSPPLDVRYLDLADYLYLAGAALDVAPEARFDVADLGLAESALHAPAATFAGVEFHPDLVTKAAALVTRLAKNHALPDGDKRAAFPCHAGVPCAQREAVRGRDHRHGGQDRRQRGRAGRGRGLDQAAAPLTG
jgi:hypothetical protein